MFLIDAIKPNVKINSRLYLSFMRPLRGGESGAYKIKTSFVSFRYRLFKRNKKRELLDNSILEFTVSGWHFTPPLYETNLMILSNLTE